MIIYPAIDLRDGKCVRLYQGDFTQAKTYSHNPATMLEVFAAAGGQWVHMVDLDGAQQGQLQQGRLIGSLIRESKLKIEVGGGIRSSEDLNSLFTYGVERVVIGSIAVSQPQLVNSWLQQFGNERITLALDCSIATDGIPKVRTHGWQAHSHLSVMELLAMYPTIKYVLCTDIAVDGTLQGPNLNLYQQIQQAYPEIALIASGGVGSLADLQALKQLQLHGVVVGKALYENQFTLQEALAI